MKKILLLSVAVAMAAGSLHAHGGKRGYYRDWGYGGWIFPFVVGGILGSAASRQSVVYETEPRVIYTTPPTMIVEDTGVDTFVEDSENEWREAPVYEERWIYFEDCKCERKVLINTQH
ncbi:MAG TPA: hypothetical protein VFX68_07615 [Sulfuricurvum sp.]|nr:hypothetical protein [Sulfuricurvum sp.]